MSTQNPTHGTKVTESSAPQKHEHAGAIASDSLAAESTRSGGEFSSNAGSEPLGVSGKSSTFANTNTSGASKLEPTETKATRSEPDTEVYTQSKATAVSDTTALDAARNSAGVAPTYVNNQFVDTKGPKGKNLTEGGFESDDKKNASWSQDIGGKNDPGRLAVESFERGKAEREGVLGTQKGVQEGTYDALMDEEA